MKAARPLSAGLAALVVLFAALCTAASAEPSLPRDEGLPVAVQAAATVLSIESFDENAGKFRATVDLRLRWPDSRLASGNDGDGTPETLRGRAAEARMKEIWIPPVRIANQAGGAELSEYGLKIYPAGRAELLHRVTADFTVDVNVERFPFDRQKLAVEIAADGLTTSEMILRFDQSDIDFSRPSAHAELGGWTIGLIDLKSAPQPGWYNATHARVVAALDIERKLGLVVASIFIPLLASLLIPQLAIWLNTMEDGVFQVDTYEMVNIIIGGLFAIIALNFTVYSSYTVLSVGDNTVNRLFALNYIGLASALFVNVVFSRFNVVARAFGPYVQEQAYIAIMWAIPTLIFVLAASFILAAYV
jgi:hypothetical protein